LVAVAINFLINRLADFMFVVLFDISIDSSVDVFFDVSVDFLFDTSVDVMFESEQGDILVEGTTSGDELSVSDDI
jgi:hypothetical protein